MVEWSMKKTISSFALHDGAQKRKNKGPYPAFLMIWHACLVRNMGHGSWSGTNYAQFVYGLITKNSQNYGVIFSFIPMYQIVNGVKREV